tara:strand:- start:635 stop:793 length:159 start_codon:yes stop_codon:yes gene_type:complete
MKIKLCKDHSIAGKIETADAIVDIHQGVALDLIQRGIAESLSKPKSKAKKEN